MKREFGRGSFEVAILATEIFGIVVAIAGLYLALDRHAYDASTVSESGGVDSSHAVALSLAVTGLLVLTAVFSRPASWWGPSILDGGGRSAVYWTGTLLLLGGALSVVVLPSQRAMTAGIAAFATGASCLFGLVGNTAATGAALAVAGISGWLLQRRRSSVERRAIAETSSSPVSGVAHEPLLISMTVVLLCWLIGSAVYNAATVEAGPMQFSRANGRSLPRPVTNRIEPKVDVDLNARTIDRRNSRRFLVASILLATAALAGTIRIPPRRFTTDPSSETS